MYLMGVTGDHFKSWAERFACESSPKSKKMRVEAKCLEEILFETKDGTMYKIVLLCALVTVLKLQSCYCQSISNLYNLGDERKPLIANNEIESDKRGYFTQNVGQQLSLALKLCDCMESLNDAVGRNVLNIFFVNNVSAILTAYASISVIFCNNNTHLPALFSFCHLCLTVLFIVR